MYPIWIPLLVLLLASSLYAVLLTTSAGKAFATSKTWVTVVFGTALVLAALAWHDPAAARVALLFFAVGAAPIIARSIYLEFQREQSVADGAMKK